jgi:NaMN:DMB phosphoribosyltransferase
MEAEAPVEAEPAPVVAESSAATAAPDATVLEVAERLERIAQALRTRPLHELLAAGGDPLDAMIAGIALGYAKQRGR